MPEAASPVMHSDMGWQYQHDGYCKTLEEAGIVQSASRKGNCIDNGATEQVFGHIKDEFFRGQSFESFEEFKERLEAYIVHWNTRRRQVRTERTDPGGIPEPVLSSIATFIFLVQEPGRSSTWQKFFLAPPSKK